MPLSLLCHRAPPSPPLFAPDPPPSTLQKRCQLRHLLYSSMIHHHELLHQFSFPCYRLPPPTKSGTDPTPLPLRLLQDISFEWHRDKDKDFLWEYHLHTTLDGRHCYVPPLLLLPCFLINQYTKQKLITHL